MVDLTKTPAQIIERLKEVTTEVVPVVVLAAVESALDLPDSPGRGALLDAMRGRVIGKGQLAGGYARP